MTSMRSGPSARATARVALASARPRSGALSRCMKRNSLRSSPTPSPPTSTTRAASLDVADVGDDLDRDDRPSSSRRRPTRRARARAGSRRSRAAAPTLRLVVPLGAMRISAGVAIEHDARAIREIERARIDAGDRGNAEPAREDRGVRRRAAGRRAEAEHARAIERGGIRRREILGDEDRVGWHLPARRQPSPTSRWSTRRPTSRMSAARPANELVLEREQPFACVVYARFQANAALAPSRMPAPASSSSSGSSSSSSCAAKISARCASASSRVARAASRAARARRSAQYRAARRSCCGSAARSSITVSSWRNWKTFPMATPGDAGTPRSSSRAARPAAPTWGRAGAAPPSARRRRSARRDRSRAVR